MRHTRFRRAENEPRGRETPWSIYAPNDGSNADLLASHPHLRAVNPALRETTRTAVDRMRGGTELMPQARQDLANVAYAVRLSSR
jgi:hypothetical protein